MVGEHLHPREQRVEMRRDHLLQRDELAAPRHRHEAGEQRRHLHAREALLTGRRVAHDDREVQRQVGDVRERVCRVDRQGSEHREDALIEDPCELRLGIGAEIAPVREVDAGLAQRGRDVLGEDRGLTRHELLDAFADRPKLLDLVESIR